jgi:hypothetical protein
MLITQKEKMGGHTVSFSKGSCDRGLIATLSQTKKYIVDPVLQEIQQKHWRDIFLGV